MALIACWTNRVGSSGEGPPSTLKHRCLKGAAGQPVLESGCPRAEESPGLDADHLHSGWIPSPLAEHRPRFILPRIRPANGGRIARGGTGNRGRLRARADESGWLEPFATADPDAGPDRAGGQGIRSLTGAAPREGARAPGDWQGRHDQP